MLLKKLINIINDESIYKYKFVNDKFKNEIKLIVKDMFPKLNSYDINILNILTSFLVEKISSNNFFKKKEKYYLQWKQNEGRDIKSTLLMLLPYIDDKESKLTNKKEKQMSITLPDLPYAQDALEPHISANTLSFHYGKHHNAYVTNLNKLIEGTQFADSSLEDIIRQSEGGIFNNAAQVWNHTFYWESLSPNGGGAPTGAIAGKIEAAFGSADEFIKQFAAAGMAQFGSGWAWLVADGDSVKIVKTPNAETPLTTNQKPLLTIDV